MRLFQGSGQIGCHRFFATKQMNNAYNDLPQLILYTASNKHNRLFQLCNELPPFVGK